MIFREEGAGGREGVTTDEERVARGGLNRDHAVQIRRLSSGKSFIGKSNKFIFNAFADFKPMWRFENNGDVTEFGSLNHSTGNRVRNNRKTICLIFWKVVVQRVAVIKLRVNNRCGNGTGSFEVKRVGIQRSSRM